MFGFRIDVKKNASRRGERIIRLAIKVEKVGNTEYQTTTEMKRRMKPLLDGHPVKQF